MVIPMQRFMIYITAWTRHTACVGALLAALVLTMVSVTAAEAKMNIQEVTSPGGIKAWLVESRQVPLIAMRFAFSGGAAQDTDGKEGIANFVSGMLDEGAGDLKSVDFQ